ncbi:hypothetical protein F5883DRAFT_698676 [Diaporthe sp. PMI_573]|nr:hypothetical protein F5883DRAFT_698676 [Diaporthaceae sp. PMI_573]
MAATAPERPKLGRKRTRPWIFTCPSLTSPLPESPCTPAPPPYLAFDRKRCHAPLVVKPAGGRPLQAVALEFSDDLSNGLDGESLFQLIGHPAAPGGPFTPAESTFVMSLAGSNDSFCIAQHGILFDIGKQKLGLDCDLRKSLPSGIASGVISLAELNSYQFLLDAALAQSAAETDVRLVHFAALTLREQIQASRDTDVLVGMHGAESTSSATVMTTMQEKGVEMMSDGGGINEAA